MTNVPLCFMIPTNGLRCTLLWQDWHLKRGGSSSRSAVSSNKVWACISKILLRGDVCGAQTLCGITAAVSNNTSARALQMGRVVQTEEWAWIGNPSLQEPLSHSEQRGEIFLSFSPPTFLPLPFHLETNTKNYAHCLILDMDRSRWSVWRLGDKLVTRPPPPPPLHVTHISKRCNVSYLRQRHCCVLFKRQTIKTILHLTGFGGGGANV